MEDKSLETTNQNKKETKAINIVNIAALLIMLLCCLVESGGIFSFIIGAALSVGNLISMIVYIAKKNVYAYVSNIIWMLALPIIGFGCCAATINFNVH